MRKSLFRPLDYLITWAIVPYYAAAIVIVALVSGYAGSLWIGSHLIVGAIMLFATYYLWAKVVRNWCLEYFVGRLQRFEPLRSSTVAVDERGLTYGDELSTHWMDWRVVRAAQLIKEGIIITFGAQGLLIPNRAFSDIDARDQFLELINQNAKAGQA